MSGSKGARASPDLIAACHVFHRLSTPRHPSEALMRLIVLSKTHAWGRLSAQVRNQANAHTCALSYVFSGKPSNSQGERANPSIHDVIEPAAARPAVGNSYFRDRVASRHRSTSPKERSWWSQTGSNRRPHACKARALPTELWPRCRCRRPVRPRCHT